MEESNQNHQTNPKIENTDTNASQPEELKKPSKKKRFSLNKKTITIAVAAIILLLAGVLWFVIRGEQNKSSTNGQKQVSTNDQIGDSDGKIPYAPVDKGNSVSGTITRSGGSLSTTLENGVKVYLVVPEGSAIEGAQAAIKPYKALPSQPSHGEMSTDYGYGAQVELDSAQISLSSYLVFDTTGGEASRLAKASGNKFINRCDPGSRHFNPFVCARLNDVPVNQMASRDAVVTPIHKEKFNDLVFTRNTVPVGIEGLIVTTIDKGDVYLPQKLNRQLAERYTDKTLGSYMNGDERLEAFAVAKNWNLNLSNEQLDFLYDSNDSDSYQTTLKWISLMRSYGAELEDRLKAAREKTANNPYDDDAEYEAESLEYIRDDVGEVRDKEITNLYEDIVSDTKEFGSVGSVEAAGAAEAASELGLEGAGSTKSQVESNIDNAPANESIGDTRARAEADNTINSGAETSSDNLQSAVRSKVQSTLSDPNASISDLLNAAAAAQLAGLEDASKITQQVIERIKEILKNRLDDPELTYQGALNSAALAQSLGLDNLGQQFIDKAKTLTPAECDLTEKNLSNYGINECTP